MWLLIRYWFYIIYSILPILSNNALIGHDNDTAVYDLNLPSTYLSWQYEDQIHINYDAIQDASKRSCRTEIVNLHINKKDFHYETNLRNLEKKTIVS